jgi:hypothetical protein
MPKRFELLAPFDNGEEVVARERAHLAGKTSCAIGKENFSIAEASRIEQELSCTRVAGMGGRTPARPT